MRWRRLVDKQRCFFANLRAEIKGFNDLPRHLSCTRSFIGSRQRISTTTSNGRVGSELLPLSNKVITVTTRGHSNSRGNGWLCDKYK